MLAAATVPHSSSGSAWTLHVDTSSRHKMIICAFFLARPPETSFKAVNKQVSLDSPLSITTVCHFISPPELRSECTTFYSLLTRVVFMPPTQKRGTPPMSWYPKTCTFRKKKAPFQRKICLELCHLLLHFTFCCY